MIRLSLFLLLFAIPALALSPQERPRLALDDGADTALLEELEFGVVLADGTELLSGDPRFELSVTEGEPERVIVLRDTLEQLDLRLELVRLDERAFLARLVAHNCGDVDLALERLVVLAGRIPFEGAPGKVLPNGLHSWEGRPLFTLEPGNPARDSYWTIALERPELAAGFLMAQRNVTRFTIAAEEHGVHLRALAECEGCVLPAGASRETDPLFFSFESTPLAELEHFASLAAEANDAAVWSPNFATWCSWYAGWIREGMHEHRGGLQAGVEANLPHVAELFGERRGATMRIVDDSDEMPYGDWDDVTRALPGGFDRLVAMMREQGVTPGIWLPVYWVAETSQLRAEHPEWLGRDVNGELTTRKLYGNTMHFLDSSRSDVQEHLERVAAGLRERGFRYVMTDFLVHGLEADGRTDMTMTKGEAHRAGLEALRRGFGDDVYWLGCGALLGSSMGLVDGMRISGDSFGDQPYSYLQAGQRWFYHRRLWLNDPDAIVCRGKGVEWNRGWMSWMALSGSVLTYGDTFDDLAEEQVELYRRVFPPLDVAGRPLDLFENDPYYLWGVGMGEGAARQKLFGLFCFDEPGGLDIELNLDEVAARIDSFREKPAEAPRGWLLWDFWNPELIEVDGARTTLPLPRRTGRVFAMREELGRPQLLGTSGHFSQGYLEVRHLTWNETARRLSGEVRGNGGDATTLYFHLPAGFELASAKLGGEPVATKQARPRVLELDVPALGTPVPLELVFDGVTREVPRRAFVRGRCADPVFLGRHASDGESFEHLRALSSRAPVGYRLAAYLDCGMGEDTSGEAPRLRLVRGEPFTWPGAAAVGTPEAATVVFDEERLVFEVDGASAAKRYQLGLTWWDYDANGRAESVTANGETLVDGARLPAWRDAQEGPESLLFLLPPPAELPARSPAAGALGYAIEITRVAGSHNAVVSEVWLWERVD